MKFFISGKITGDSDYQKKFADVETALVKKGHSVMNPAWLKDEKEFSWDDYMIVSESMQRICEAVFFLPSWEDSKGAKKEYERAVFRNQKKFFELDKVPDYNKRCYVVCNAKESHTLSRNECMEFLKITDADLSRIIENGTARRGYTVDVMEV